MGCIFGITDDTPLHFTFKYTVMKLKKYGAIGVMEWQLNLPVGKATVHVEFKGGFENKYGIHPATFMTTDPIVQTVIERSYYFTSGKIKLLDVKDLGLSPMEIAAQKRKAEEADKKKKAEEADKKKKADAEVQAKAEADAQAGNAQGQAIESPGTVASESAADDTEAELGNETEEVAENGEAEENAVDGSVYDVEGETDMGDIVAFTANPANIDALAHFDLLTGGFPCQTFSVMGQQAGFDEDRGQMFFRIMDIIQARHPRYVLLENVKNLYRHDNGNTYARIEQELQNEGYHVF